MTPVSLDELIAREFVLDDPPYLNSAATGPMPRRATAAQCQHVELRATPWRLDPAEMFAILERSRELVAALIGASPREIALMTNTSSGVNLAARALPLVPGDVVLISDRDFPANVYPWLALERDRGVIVRRVPCRDRLFDESALLAALGEPRVKILAVSWVSFETGVRLDLDRLGTACRANGVYFVVDAIQGLGALTLDVRQTPVDLLACGAQKWLLSPWGTGFAYVREGLIGQLEPKQVGWMSVRDSDDFSRMLAYDLTYRDDARRFEVVTLPFQDFAGMNASLEVFHEAGPARVAARVQDKAQRIVDWALERPGVRLGTPAESRRRAGIVSLETRDAARASERLNAAGIAHSLREGAIRLSPHFFTPDEHIDRALQVLARDD
jgi:selenocysteine lyase/cysteine desulfurase